METTVSVKRQNGEITLINGEGKEWTMKGIDEESAIAALLFFTVKYKYEAMKILSDDFSIRISMEAVFNK